METLNTFITNSILIEKIEKLIEDQSISDSIVNIFIDILKSENSKDFLSIDHNSRKVHYNLSISTKERNQLSQLISILYPSSKIETPFKDFFPLKTREIPNINSELVHKGFHVFDNLLDFKTCDAIISELEKIPFHTKKSTKKIKGLSESNLSKINGNTAWVTNQQDIIQIPEVQKLAFDENLLNLVGEFLGSEPILCQTNCWWSVNKSTHRSNLSTNAQLFHQDTEYLKFIKVFIYLTDVNEKNGPHQYVQGSSQIAQEKLGGDYKPSDRIEDEKVEEVFGEENLLTFTGKKGCIIIEDTFGLHKGTPVVEGARLLLQLEYCNSLYFHAGYSFGKEALNDDLNQFSNLHPRIFSNFTNNVNELNEKKFQYFNKRTLSQKVKDKIKSYL